MLCAAAMALSGPLLPARSFMAPTKSLIILNAGSHKYLLISPNITQANYYSLMAVSPRIEQLRWLRTFLRGQRTN